MTVPSVLQSEGYFATLEAIREALERRVTNATNRLSVTPVYHRGAPNSEALPNEELGVWLDWTDVEPDDQDETNRATFLQSQWVCYIIGLDEGADGFGNQIPTAEQAMADILLTLTMDNTDLGLDGACDIVDVPRASKQTVYPGNRRHQAIAMRWVVRHQMAWVRTE
jgi:hypothetical protein